MDKPLTKKQKDFLRVLKAKACNISAALDAFGIDRTTDYEWLSNPAYQNTKKNMKVFENH